MQRGSEGDYTVERGVFKTLTVMLQAKTEEQKRYIESILEKDDTCAEWGIDIDSEYENCLFIYDCITFDTMAKIVDYLRNKNK